MIRILLIVAALFLLSIGFAWMADLPGTVSVSWNGYVWEQTPVVAAIVAGVLLVVFLLAVWVIRVVLKSPQIASRFFQRRRKDKGYTALSHGLIALGTGNAKLARRYALDADRLLSEEPAAKLLLAQTAQLAGKDSEARERFEAMLDDPATKALGLHGLFVEAERHKEPLAARHYAEEAVKTQPGLEWAGKAVLGYQAVAHNWDEALKSLERNYASKMLDKKTYRRQRAVILTALAQDLEDGNPDRAYALAKEAHGLALDLVPAAVTASRLATRRGDIRKASKVLEATWRLAPHPDLAETYAHVRTGDSAVDRLKRVKSLSAQRANTSEGAVAIARAALEAREFDEARAQLKKVLQSESTRSAFLLMAEVEDAETGDKGRIRDWLARAVRAPQDKAWVADGIVSADWQAVSPVTGRIDAFQWVTPSTLDDESGDVLEDSMFDAPVLPPVSAPAQEAEPEVQSAPVAKADAEPAAKAETDVATADVEPAQEKEAAPAAPEPLETQKKVTVSSVKEGYEGTTEDVKYAPPLHDLPDKDDVVAAGKPEPKTEGIGSKPPETGAAPEVPAEKADQKPAEPAHGEGAGANGASKDDDKPITFALSRMPDDPGTDEDDGEQEKKSNRPRFFN
ncbi:heme biosynthesis protein HemY [Roseibium denhamense]|uniref:HemY protein n=1 Tax=Roseibium denhamense TaxID=76305 RepID=A0ABY1P8X1_9HYPH|nr:heme biosynthesis HemY N-terminal domain-containing protein [Roseibium denhamense]MTI04552.1 heme biosynthesis protein HemY [Roseibium denhamense]SMP28428.1 HemY protein [Roseibium denhamense]